MERSGSWVFSSTIEEEPGSNEHMLRGKAVIALYRLRYTELYDYCKMLLHGGFPHGGLVVRTLERLAARAECEGGSYSMPAEGQWPA